MKLEQIGKIQRISDEVRVWVASCGCVCEIWGGDQGAGFRFQGSPPTAGRAVGPVQGPTMKHVACFFWLLNRTHEALEHSEKDRFFGFWVMPSCLLIRGDLFMDSLLRNCSPRTDD